MSEFPVMYNSATGEVSSFTSDPRWIKTESGDLIRFDQIQIWSHSVLDPVNHNYSLERAFGLFATIGGVGVSRRVAVRSTLEELIAIRDALINGASSVETAELEVVEKKEKLSDSGKSFRA